MYSIPIQVIEDGVGHPKDGVGLSYLPQSASYSKKFVKTWSSSRGVKGWSSQSKGNGQGYGAHRIHDARA